MALAEWLDTNSETADRAYGAYFHDPAKSALYADEVKELTDKMKSTLEKLVEGLKEIGS